MQRHPGLPVVDHEPDGGAIAGIIIALLVGFCCIGACVFFVMKKPAGKGGAPAAAAGRDGEDADAAADAAELDADQGSRTFGQPYYYNNATGVDAVDDADRRAKDTREREKRRERLRGK